MFADAVLSAGKANASNKQEARSLCLETQSDTFGFESLALIVDQKKGCGIMKA